MIYGHKQKEVFFKNIISRENLGKAHLGHAYLFFGEPQIGKYHFTKHLSYFLEYGKFEILEKPLLDTFVIKSEEGGKIGVDKVKEIKRFLFQKPFHSNKRIAVINDAENMTSEAQASLLKIVEESPSHNLLIFIVKNPQSLLPPLVSRLQKIYFSHLSSEKIKNILVKDFKTPEKKAKEITEKSLGHLGKALNLLNQEEENNSEENIEKFVEDKILSLFIEDKLKNTETLKWLIAKEKEIKRFNLNPKLQNKVIKARIKQV
jgi:DNA polymerase III subunit delta'